MPVLPDRKEAERLLEQLRVDPAADASRLAVCESVSNALAHLGRLMWVGGYLIGPDRRAGVSPYGFGDDAAVGLATVAQIGGELSSGAINLLKAGNLYAAEALVRQLVEVEYLAHAFAHDHPKAAEWLRADRAARRTYWTPAAVRKRADGAFDGSDYWAHCDVGGHPTTDGRRLLPDHAMPNVAHLWVDLAGHLCGLWTNIRAAADQALGGSKSVGLVPPDVDETVASWQASDELATALRSITRPIGEDRRGA